MSDKSLKSEHTISVGRKRKGEDSSYASSVLTFASSSYSSDLSGLKTPKDQSPLVQLPPISSLLSVCYNKEPNNMAFYTPHMPQPLKKKRKLNLNNSKQVFMPMIPYYFHHDQFGIESCMLQLEGQRKFSNFYYI